MSSLASALDAANAVAAEEANRILIAQMREAELAALAHGVESEAQAISSQLRGKSNYTPTTSMFNSNASGLNSTPQSHPSVPPSIRPTSMSAARSNARSRSTSRVPQVASSFPLPLSHPLQQQAAMAAVAASASTPGKVVKERSLFDSNLKSNDPYSIAQYLEEGRLAFQGGKFEDALRVYVYLDSLKAAVPYVNLHMACCRRQLHQEQQAISNVQMQLKLNEQAGIHALVKSASGNTSMNMTPSESSSDLPAESSHANDPDHIASSLVAEWERLQCYEQLKEVEAARKSASNLKKMMDSTKLVYEISNQYACWMAMAKFLASLGYDLQAKLALEKARDAVKEEDPSLGLYVNEPHWLLLHAYISWSMGEYDMLPPIASHLAHTPHAALIAEVDEEGLQLIEDIQRKVNLLYAGSCLSTEIGLLSLDTAMRILDDITTSTNASNQLTYPIETLATAWTMKANVYLLRGSLRQAIAALKQAQAFEIRVTSERSSAVRFPYFGPVSISATAASSPTSASSAQLPPTSHLSIYDLKRSLDLWVARGPRSGLPPNFEVLVSAGGFQPVHASSRYLAVLLDFFSELLLKYGSDARVLYYRSNIWSALGNIRMQLHDLEILNSVAPLWYSQYCGSQTACDWGDMNSSSCPVSKLRVIPLLALHMVATSYGTHMFDKNVASSAFNIVALQRKYYLYLLRIPQTHSTSSANAQMNTPRLNAAPHSVGGAGHVRHPSTSFHDAEVARVSGHHHQRVPSTSSFSSRAGTSHSAFRQNIHSSAAFPSINYVEWDSVPMGGLLDCEDPLYIEAVIADLTRQHANSYSALATTNAMIAAAQTSFENVLRQLENIAAPQSPSPSSSQLTILQIHTQLICYEGLALIHNHRFKFSLTYSHVMDGLHRVWSQVDRIIERKEERAQLLKLKTETETNGDGAPTLTLNSLASVGGSSPNASKKPSARGGLTATQILNSSAPFHIKALKLTMPLLIAVTEDPSFGTVDGTLPADHDNEGTVYSETSYWESERSSEYPKASMGKPNASDFATFEWLEPARLLMTSLRRHAAVLLSILGMSYMLEANTDVSLLLFYRSIAIDPREFFANLYLFQHHFRFSPLNLCIQHYINVYENVPFFIPNQEAINMSPLRYPLEFDSAFSGSFTDPNAEVDEKGNPVPKSHNPFEFAMHPKGDGNAPVTRRNSVATVQEEKENSTLAYPFPRCLHRCLTSRLMDRPYTHASSAETSIYLQSMSSHVQAMKHRNEITLKLHKQHELVEKWKTEQGLPGAKKLDLDAVLTNSIAAVASTDNGNTPLILSLNHLHPIHPFHPLQQKAKLKSQIEEDAKTAGAAATGAATKPGAKPTPPTKGGPAQTGGRTSKANPAAKDKTKKAAAEVVKLSTFSLAEMTQNKGLPPFFHVEHRPYQPSSAAMSVGGANSWSAQHWYKEAMKLLSYYDKNGVLFCFLKCLHLDIDYCASLNYVLSLLETNLTESNVSFASVQMMKDMKEIEALEAEATGTPLSPSKPSLSKSTGINKHSYDSLAAMFGKDKVLPIVWDIFIRGKQFEEFYGNVEISYSEYSYALMFMSLGDVLWRRGLIERAHDNITLSLVDISEAIKCTLVDQTFLEKVPIVPITSRKSAQVDESKHMSDKEKKELAAQKAIAANAHTPQASLAIVRHKLEVYHLIRALIFYNQSNFSSATMDTQECLNTNPRNATALRLRSLCLTYLAKYDEAITNLERYLEVESKDLGSRLRLANLYSFSGYHEKANRQFDRILNLAPTNAEVLYAKGLGYYRQHMWHDAHDMFQQCIAQQPKFWLAYMRQGEVLERLESYELAIDTLQIALSGFTASAAAGVAETIESQSEGYVRLESFHLDYIHRTIGRIYLTQAQQIYMSILAAQEEERKQEAKRKREVSMRGEDSVQTAALNAEQKRRAAIEMATEEMSRLGSPLAKKRTTDWDSLITSATNEAKQMRAEAASRASAIRSGALSTEQAIAAGKLHPRKRDVTFVSKCLHMAFGSLQAAIADNPGVDDAESHYLLALTLLFLAGNRSKDPQGKIWILLDRVVQLEPRHADAHFLRGFLLQRDGRVDDAASEYDVTLSIESEHVLALQARGYIHFMKEEKQKAIDTYTQMMNHPGPLRSIAYANRGLVHMLNHNNYAALSDLDYAISSAPHHALAYLYRAETHKALGFMSEAISDFRTAAPMLKKSIEDADHERVYLEGGKGLKRAVSTTHHSRTRSSLYSANAVTPTAQSARPPSSLLIQSPSSGAADGTRPPPSATGSSDTPFFPGLEAHGFSGLGPVSAIGAVALNITPTSIQSHNRRSSFSLSILSDQPPYNGSSATTASTGVPPLHARPPTASSTRWAGLRVLLKNKQLTPALIHSPKLGATSVTPPVDLQSAPLFPRPPSSATPVPLPPRPSTKEKDLERPVSRFDMDSIHLHPVNGAEHFRMSASAGAITFASEVGLTQVDLDSIHNSLGILLHQQAGLKKKALIHANGQRKLTGAEAKSKMAGNPSMALTIGAQLTAGAGGPGSPDVGSRTLGGSGDGEDEEALMYFSKGSSQYQAHYNRALIYLEKGKLHTALNEFRHAVEAAPEFADAHNNYGVVAQKTGSNEEAAKHYSEALRLTHNRHLIACFNLANIKANVQQYPEAIRLYTIFLKRVQKMQREAAFDAKHKKVNPLAVAAGGPAVDAKDASKHGVTASQASAATHEGGFESLQLSDSVGSTSARAPDFLPQFERDLLAYGEGETKEADAKNADTPSKKGKGKKGGQDAAGKQKEEHKETVPSMSSEADRNLIKLLPLALNNRAICYQNLSRNEEALRGYTSALRLNPKLTYVHFNRAHLYMAMGNCFDALEDIKEYTREKAVRDFHLDQSNRSSTGRAEQAELQKLNSIEQDMLTAEGGNGASSNQKSSSSMEYLKNFFDYCKRFQWGLSVATKDLLTGIKCMPILSNLNLNVPAIPLALFNPHMLPEAGSLDWTRLQTVLSKLNPDDLLRTEYDAAVVSGTAAPDVRLRAVFAPAAHDSACVIHVKQALRAQVMGKLVEALDALLKALYLLPPSPLFLQQQRLDFAKRHNLNPGLNNEASWALEPPGIKEYNGLDSALRTELSGELHEILILWRARMLCSLSRYDDAVGDLEFYVSAVAGDQSAQEAKLRREAQLRMSKERRGDGDSESDEQGNDDPLPPSIIPVALGDSSVHASTAVSKSVSQQISRAQSRAEKRASLTVPGSGSTLISPSALTGIGITPGSGASSSAFGWRPSHQPSDSASFRTSEEELLERNRLALFAHRQSVRQSRVLTYLGSLYHMQRRDADAHGVYTMATEFDRGNFYALLNRSLVSRLQGRYSNAINDLFEVLKIISRLDEQQRKKDVAKKSGVAIPVNPDPLWVSSVTIWEPELETGLADNATPRLTLTTPQRNVMTVLMRYGEVLKLNPQESWDAITGLQGQLAIACDTVIAERMEKKKKNVSVAKDGKSSSNADGESDSSDEESAATGEKKLSAADASSFFREQLDEAADRMMNHLIDPKAARDKEAAIAASSSLPVASSKSGTQGDASVSNPANSLKHLDSSFTDAFSRMQSLIETQLPKKMHSQKPTPVVGAVNANQATLTATRTTTTTTTTTTKTTYKLQHPSGGSFQIDPANLPFIPATIAALSGGGAVPTSAPASQLSALISSLNARAKASLPADSAHSDATASNSTTSLISSARSDASSLKPTQPSGPSSRKAGSSRGSSRGKVAGVVAAAANAAAASSSSSASSNTKSTPVSASAIAKTTRRAATPEATDEREADQQFLESLDPSMPAEMRAQLLEERQLKRIAAVKEKFGVHGRRGSYFGLLGEGVSPSSPLEAARMLNKSILQQMELDQAEEEDEEFSSLDDDDE